MLTEEEFHRWCQRRAVSSSSREEIGRIRSTPPTRHVRSAAGNVSGRYPSRKKVGFRHEGRMRDALWWESTPYDTLLMAVLATEWEG